MRTRTAMELISTLVILLLAWVVLLALDLLAAGLLALVGAGFKKVFCWGLLALLIPPLMMLYGILVERNCYRVVPVEVPVEGLPDRAALRPAPAFLPETAGLAATRRQDPQRDGSGPDRLHR